MFQYMLEGYDKHFSSATNNTTAVFGNLREGNYTFKLKAFSRFGSHGQLEYNFRILPPWQRTWWAYSLYTLIFLSILFFADRFRRKKLIQKEQAKIKEKELAQAKEIEKAYHELKSTQAQLVQSEKMASLGALTAGIAHEIQNPLNFINNFSELNAELIAEMEQEMKNGTVHNIKNIVNDIKENEEKITHHGKRAGAIVKAMLQHSRSDTGIKEQTDINALTDEYLQLSYHGIRARDNSFKAKITKDYDPLIGSIKIIPQELGRVLLNLYNNAFYAVAEKSKKNLESYIPTVSVSTKKIDNRILITVRDNGIGISPAIIDKIFNPFFTTKPPGDGTGLGLSLSYDIIKAHGGKLHVNSKEGEYAEFIVELEQIK
jgi:signal transduction histidine kinase